ncbi:Two-component hybrid sensor and regulator [hydrothermal vent metagenome]|uniref:histidine kinase n=1 Tax=hydrothermal vent metagenome TaxID=652676 RepID=A0A3B0Z061_9ZZZZ
MTMNVSISSKITFAAVMLVLVTAMAVGVVVHSGGNKLLVAQETENLGDQNHIAAARLIARIEALRQDVRFLAATPPIQGIVRSDLATDAIDPLDGSTQSRWHNRLATIFSQFLLAKPDYLQVRYIGIADGGRELVRVERSADGAPQVVATAALQRKGEQPYFRDAIRFNVGQIYLSEVTLNREQGHISEPAVAVMRAALPIHTPGGELFGLVIINMDFLAALNTVIDEHRYGDKLRFYVTNDRGDYLIHPDPARAFGFERGERQQLQHDYPQLATLFGSADGKGELTLHAESEHGNEALNFYKAAFDPLNPERFIGLALAASYQQVIADSIAVRNRSAALTLLLIGLGGGLAWLFSRLLSGPLQQITSAAEQVAAGRFDVSLPVNAGGELGLLAKRFEQMVRQVHERGEALGRRADDLARVNNELDQFAYAASHDLKAPLRAIANLSCWIEEDIRAMLTPETRQQMALLRGRVHRMEGLLEAILLYSQVGRTSVVAEMLDVTALLDEVIKEITAPADFTFEIGDGMPTFEAPRKWLILLFTHLVDNAVKFHDRADGRVTITVNERDDYYQFTVSDDGPGIAAEYHERIFTIFQTLQARDQFESTGVGLTLVKKIVEAYGGSITVDSSEGKGARFSFTWPKQLDDCSATGVMNSDVGRVL